MGFSAGAELVAPATVFYDKSDQANNSPGDALRGISSRPDFAVLIYPGPTPFARDQNTAIPRDARSPDQRFVALLNHEEAGAPPLNLGVIMRCARRQTVAKAPAARARRTKAEVQQEFESVRREAVAQREAADPRAEEAARSRETDVRQAAEGVSVDQVVGGISALGLQLSKALGELSGRLVSEVERLATLREAVRLEQRELQRLHDVDVVATAVAHLVQDYEAKKGAFQAEMATARAEWEAETGERERSSREYEEALKKQRQRENDEFEYKKALERKKLRTSTTKSSAFVIARIGRSRKRWTRAGRSAKSP